MSTSWIVGALALAACGGNPHNPGGPQGGVACQLPAAMSSSNEETAWRLFVAASCDVGGKLAWETWTEQSCFSDPSGPGCGGKAPAHRLHDSKLRRGLVRAVARDLAAEAKVDVTPGPCNFMTGAKNAPPHEQPPPSLVPFIPTNLAPDAKFCEEVYVNTAEADYVRAPAPGQILTTPASQAAFASTTPIAFPTPSIELKADWVSAASLGNAFDCAGNHAGLYVETIDGVCYALVGVHLSSKLLPDWLWATFEPQSKITNPNRCNPQLYNACNDPWGSSPAASTGQDTAPSAALTALIKSAGLPDALLNYRLTAAQSTYVDNRGQAIELGNSFVEFNAQVLPHQASCMTCHAYAMVSKSTSGAVAENPNFGAFPGTPAIGTPGAPPPVQGGGQWYPLDFSWMLGVMR